ncbi:hypothetical protein MMM7_09080 [Helicobacter pylori]
MASWIFRMLNTKYLLYKHYAFKASLREKLREAGLLSQIKVRASGHFNEKVD